MAVSVSERRVRLQWPWSNWSCLRTVWNHPGLSSPVLKAREKKQQQTHETTVTHKRGKCFHSNQISFVCFNFSLKIAAEHLKDPLACCLRSAFYGGTITKSQNWSSSGDSDVSAVTDYHVGITVGGGISMLKRRSRATLPALFRHHVTVFFSRRLQSATPLNE